MCNPAAVVMLVAAGIGAYAQIEQSRAQAHIAEENADLARFAARDRLESGDIAEEELRRRGERFKGMQRARLAAMGGALDTGSAIDILEDTAGEVEYGALKIRSGAEREAYQLLSQANIFDFQAGQFTRVGRLTAASTFIGGAAGAWAQGGGKMPTFGRGGGATGTTGTTGGSRTRTGGGGSAPSSGYHTNV